jgi:NADH-quinone oxidoreductase subunit N
MTPNLLPASVDLAVAAPAEIVTLTALILMILSAVAPNRRGILATVAIVGLAVALAAQIGLAGGNRESFGGSLVADGLSVFFGVLALVVAGLAVLISHDFLRKSGLPAGEFYALVLFSTVGSLVLAGARDLIVVLLGIEILSLGFYVLAGYLRDLERSEESALKYFLLGAFAFGFLVYGTALMFGATGSTRFAVIAAALAKSGPTTLALAGAALLLVGFSFKLSFVPFHMWTPDVYEGAPSAVTGYMSVAVKIAGFSVLLRLLVEALPAFRPQYAPALAALAILTMVLGNVAAIRQKNLKRMLAYSSIGQAGYVLVALVAADRLGVSGVLFYVAAYAAMNLGAFAVVVAIAGADDSATSLADYSGLAVRSPWLAAALSLFLLSLAGIPPTAGFVGKLYVFSAAIDSGYAGLAIIGVLTSAAATFFYIGVIARMYMRSTDGSAVSAKGLRVAPALLVAVAIAAFFTLQLGVLPSLPLDAARAAFGALASAR